jgi:Fe-S protein assembly co-chaperone HscB
MKAMTENTPSIFTIFGLQMSDTVDIEAVDKKYAELAREHHPDIFIKQSIEQQKIAEQNMAMINKAYKILSSPKLTYQYLIDQMMKNGQPEEEIADNNDIIDIMLLHDEIDNIRNSIEYENFKKKVDDSYQIALSNVRQGIIENNIKIAQKHMNKVNFLDKILQQTKIMKFKND